MPRRTSSRDGEAVREVTGHTGPEASPESAWSLSLPVPSSVLPRGPPGFWRPACSGWEWALAGDQFLFPPSLGGTAIQSHPSPPCSVWWRWGSRAGQVDGHKYCGLSSHSPRKLSGTLAPSAGTHCEWRDTPGNPGQPTQWRTWQENPRSPHITLNAGPVEKNPHAPTSK